MRHISSNIDNSYDLPLTEYSATSPLAQPGKLFKEIVTDIWRAKELTWILFTRDLKAQFRQTYFGYAWLFVPVIVTTCVWMFLNNTQVIEVAATPIPYPLYVLLGTMIWTLFTSAVNQPLVAFNAGRPVFMKLKVPPEAFILAGLGKVIFEVTIRMLVLIPVFLILNFPLANTFWLFPLGLACTLLVGLSLGVLMIPIGSLYTDVSRAVTTGLNFAMYLTPVVYPPPKAGFAAAVVHYNPITSLVMTTRDWLTVGHNGYIPTMLFTTILAAATLIIGVVVFRVVLPHLIERMGM